MLPSEGPLGATPVVHYEALRVCGLSVFLIHNLMVMGQLPGFRVPLWWCFFDLKIISGTKFFFFIRLEEKKERFSTGCQNSKVKKSEMPPVTAETVAKLL